MLLSAEQAQQFTQHTSDHYDIQQQICVIIPIASSLITDDDYPCGHGGMLTGADIPRIRFAKHTIENWLNELDNLI